MPPSPLTCNALAVVAREDVVQQRGLAAAQEPRDDLVRRGRGESSR
jgi:hypothetical protein